MHRNEQVKNKNFKNIFLKNIFNKFVTSLNLKKMAKPINITPVLMGKDAINFLTKIKTNSSKSVKISTLQKISKDANALRAIAK